MTETPSETRAALHRLKRRLGRERGRYVKMYGAKLERTGVPDDRLFGEVNVCDIAMGFVDDELRKLG